MRRAVVVADGRLHAETALGALAAAGCEAATVADAVGARSAVEAGALTVVAGLPVGEAVERWGQALLGMPSALRRGCVIVLVGDGLTTGDGMQAFVCGVDLVINAADLPRVGDLVAAALAAKRALVGALDAGAGARLGG